MKQIIGLVFILIFWSCQDVKRPEIPENLIPEDEMAAVLTEVYLINAARSFDNRVIKDQKVKLDSFFFRKFNIDSLQFVKSNAYYTSNLNAYNALFKKVEERMMLIKVETDSLKLAFVLELEAKRIRDSICGVLPQIKADDLQDKVLMRFKQSANVKKQDSSIIVPKLIKRKPEQ
jgi:hypothetical protein